MFSGCVSFVVKVNIRKPGRIYTWLVKQIENPAVIEGQI
jgi:hypothetical protein